MAESKRYRPPGPELNGVAPNGKRGLDFQPLVVRRPLEEVMIALRKGAELMKHGRHGKPKLHLFRLQDSGTHLCWRSDRNKNQVRSILLQSVKQVVPGQNTETFKRYPVPKLANCSFSLIYKVDGDTRTLDLTCKDEEQFETWFSGIQVVLDHIAASAQQITTLPPPPQPAKVLSPLPTMAREANGKAVAPTPSPQQAVPRPQVMGGGTAHGRVSGAVGVPVLEHPGDCYVWGSCGDGAQDGEPWQHSSLPSLMKDTTFLDVQKVAGAANHAALLTPRGEMYTWGEGTGGKLGLGHDQNAAVPQRVHTLWGKVVQQIACGDNCTAAITQEGSLYMWGVGSAGNLGYRNTLRQFLPRQVIGSLADAVVTKVSCGPFHTAAATADGKLFTWGEGLNGKLGHGDQSTCSTPRFVQALSSKQVFAVACGVWHTAAVAQDRLQKALPPGADENWVPTSPDCATQALGVLQTLHDYPGQIQAGHLYTWGGDMTFMEPRTDRAGRSFKLDNNRGCLGHGDTAGRMWPQRVGGALEGGLIVDVAAGLSATIVATLHGRVFQMGEMGTSKPAKWEGSRVPEQVCGELQSVFVEKVSCGRSHAAVLASPMDKQKGRPQTGQDASMIFVWGRGLEGQLGLGKQADTPLPQLVQELKGRHMLQVTCGSNHTLAVAQHDPDREELEDRRKPNKEKMKQFIERPTRKGSEPELSAPLVASRQPPHQPTTVPISRLSSKDKDELLVTPRELGKSGGGVAKQLRLGPANAIKGALRTMTRVNSSSKPPKLPYASSCDADMNAGFSNRRHTADLAVASRALSSGSLSVDGRQPSGSSQSAMSGRARTGSGPMPGSIDSFAHDLHELAQLDELAAQSQRVNRERYVTTLEAKIDKLQSLLIKQLYANNHQTTPSSSSSPAPSPMPSLPSPEQAVAASWTPQTAELLRGRPRLSTIPSLGPWEGSPRGTVPADPVPDGTLAPPEASLSPVPSNSYEPPNLQAQGSMGRRAPVSRIASQHSGAFGGQVSAMQGQTSPFARQRADAMFMPAGMPEIVPQEEPLQPTVLHQYADHAAVPEAPQPEEPPYQEPSATYAPAAEQAYHDSQPGLRQMQDELQRRWAEAAGHSKASAAWSSSDHHSMPHQRNSMDALHDGPPMSQDGSVQSAASQDGDHLASEQAGVEEAPQGLQLPPAAVGEVEVAEGVFLTFEPTSQGQNHLTRIRFNRQHYSREAAQLWWQEHRMEIAHHYQLITDGSSAGSGPDTSASPRQARHY
ncbi:hypothetical protein WJX74_004462 [Apatococcus lobatus]|uniref:PH domain-containing protein n=1 Tax=Apatococcus lobatus TaxID=904363 RepID=A0AAW1QTR4_9CHLO